MHYIRILRPPSFVASSARGDAQLQLLLTITTDLGESFLYPLQPVDLDVVLYLHGSVEEKGGIKLPVAKGENTLRWTAGSRVLKTKVNLPPQASSSARLSRAVVCVRPLERRLSASSAADVLSSSCGLIMPLYVAPRSNHPEETMALRRLRIPEDAAEASPLCVEVEEELGESIARHVWDAGVYVAVLLTKICSSSSSSSSYSNDEKSCMPALEKILGSREKLDVLEIGSGVGILGIGLATAILGRHEESASSTKRPVSILMTDLPEAQDRAAANISRYEAMVSQRQRQRQQRPTEDEAAKEDGNGADAGSRQAPIVDYENLDWEDGRAGVFAPKILARPWDLVMLSDCTYNVDMLPALVETLSEIHSTTSPKHTSQEDDGHHHHLLHHPRVLLATKRRHDSEKALFDLMAGAGWSIEENRTFELHDFDSASQHIEVYLFGRKRP
ncbi:hypothetical protein GGTG_03784 [Gaeumannomyces tritici R3-111a-1]|uniref:Uncharacterized protein n=1 Tax=Gaeumannomyces tritici (strain R3-111a-1) TaxID=644352 RepID=J3NR79_GAET3|nr:hypothetical protein GGTG_03784 [Gaeumannomyces tritici R3-111a-1]EJT78685.1 hypothetical protein GGTG_03784 [Gaeumannomyces tritici R3-111a-1]